MLARARRNGEDMFQLTENQSNKDSRHPDLELSELLRVALCCESAV